MAAAVAPNSCSQDFHDERMSRSAARAQRSATEFLAAAFEFVDHGDHYSSAGCTDRMAEADAGTDSVEFVQTDLQFTVTTDNLCGKGFIKFKIVDVFQVHFGEFQSVFHGRYNTHAHDAGLDGTWGRSNHSGDRFDP